MTISGAAEGARFTLSFFLDVLRVRTFDFAITTSTFSFCRLIRQVVKGSRFSLATQILFLDHKGNRAVSLSTRGHRKEADMSDTPEGNSGNSGNKLPSSTDTADKAVQSEAAKIQEKSLERMEALLKQSAMGIHILFDNISIAEVLSQTADDKDFFDFNKMKRVQDVMTELISKKTYFEKMSFLRELDKDSYHMLVRTYFHIVENTVRSNHDLSH